MTVSQIQKLRSFLTFHQSLWFWRAEMAEGVSTGKELMLTMQSPLPLLTSWEAWSKVATGTWHFGFLSWPRLCCQNL